MMEYNIFVQYYYDRGYFPLAIYFNQNKELSEKDFKKYYQKYVEKYKSNFEKFNQEKELVVDDKWEDLKLKAYAKDSLGKVFWSAWNKEEKEILESKCIYPLSILDPCHIFGKGAYPHMKYELDNILIAPRYFHTCIDNYINPLTGKQINSKLRDELWIKIIGVERFQRLSLMTMKTL